MHPTVHPLLGRLVPDVFGYVLDLDVCGRRRIASVRCGVLRCGRPTEAGGRPASLVLPVSLKPYSWMRSWRSDSVSRPSSQSMLSVTSALDTQRKMVPVSLSGRAAYFAASSERSHIFC
eukprot:7385429-Prymnesium_polylepis.1